MLPARAGNATQGTNQPKAGKGRGGNKRTASPFRPQILFWNFSSVIRATPVLQQYLLRPITPILEGAFRPQRGMCTVVVGHEVSVGGVFRCQGRHREKGGGGKRGMFVRTKRGKSRDGHDAKGEASHSNIICSWLSLVLLIIPRRVHWHRI